jgi:hypothetical protein
LKATVTVASEDLATSNLKARFKLNVASEDLGARVTMTPGPTDWRQKKIEVSLAS